MTPIYNIAVIGATGVVGKLLLEVLQERRLPVGKLDLYATEHSAGETDRFAGKSHKIQHIENADFSNVQLAFFTAGSAVSAEYVPIAVKAGCVCIDNTAHFRYDKNVPLVIPEVNPETIQYYRESMIIANPNCSTIQMLLALKPLYDAAGIQRVNVATYQSVSGAGRAAITELVDQTTHLLNGQTVEAKVFPEQIAFNVIPQIDVMMENGYTKEEMKMVWETKKIFTDPNIAVNATAVRVPVIYGHSQVLHIETQQPLSTDEAYHLLANAPGVESMPKTEYPTAFTHGANSDIVFVGRIRKDISHPNGLNLWVVADNVRKGAAVNAVQIAENLIENKFYL